MFMRKLCAVSVVALVAGCSQTVDNPAQSPSYVAATLGYDAYKQGDLQGAETHFETALSSEPDNPYALLGLGAVRESTGDYRAAEHLYTAARSAGYEAKANYTYITEQRLEEASDRDVAALAEENLARLQAMRLARQTPVPATTGFASYDGGTADVADGHADDVATFGVPSGDGYLVASMESDALPVTEAYDIQPVETYAVPVAESYDIVAGGDYRQVGTYDDYVASVGAGIGTVDAVYALTDQSYEAIQPASYDMVEARIETASYGVPPGGMTVAVEPAVYSEPLSYDGMAEAEPVFDTYASMAPVYAPVSELQVPVADGPSDYPEPSGSLAYGQASGDPIDLVAATRPAKPVKASGPATTNTGGLIFLDDS